MPALDINRYQVIGDVPVDLSSYDPSDEGGLDKVRATARFRGLRRKLMRLQELMYAQDKHALLVVLQAMDAGGKDSTIRQVFGPLNPQGCRVSSFKVPNSEERARDFLWRIHRQAPPRGHIGVFNRSHYEDVLVVRVRELAPEPLWRQRYEHINSFEKLLADEGTLVVKFFLHISNDYQRQRLKRRLRRPDKHWKLSPADIAERVHWNDYQAAYAEALSRCSRPWAPWYVVPAERRWFRNLLVAEVLVQTLEALDMQWPEATFDPKTLKIE
jgi:PPK2 family polyphosphate:nucleotide phosphotransferase